MIPPPPSLSHSPPTSRPFPPSRLWCQFLTRNLTIARYLISSVDPNQTRTWWLWFGLAFSYAPSRLPTLPSWVTDFHSAAHYATSRVAITSLSPSQPRIFCASSVQSRVKLGKEMKQLLIYGKMVDEVADVFDTLPTTDDDGEQDYLKEVKTVLAISTWADIAGYDGSTSTKIAGPRYTRTKSDDKLDAVWKAMLSIDDEYEDDVSWYRILQMTLKEMRHFTSTYNNLKGQVFLLYSYCLNIDHRLGSSTHKTCHRQIPS